MKDNQEEKYSLRRNGVQFLSKRTFVPVFTGKTAGMNCMAGVHVSYLGICPHRSPYMPTLERKRYHVPQGYTKENVTTHGSFFSIPRPGGVLREWYTKIK